LNIDENGKIKNDYIIEGLIKDASINFLDRANFKNINFNFNFQKDNYHFDEINFKAEEVNFISKKLNVKKKKNSFLIDAIVENDQSSLNSNILKLLNLNFENIIVDDAKFKTNNEFSLEIDKKFKVKNIILSSDINITQLKYKKLKIINNYFPEVDDLILLNNHKLNLNYKDNNLSINGEGQIQLKTGEVDEIKYFINKKDKDLSIDSELFLKNIVLEQQDFLKIFFPQSNKNINFNNQKLKINFNNKRFSIALISSSYSLVINFLPTRLGYLFSFTCFDRCDALLVANAYRVDFDISVLYYHIYTLSNFTNSSYSLDPSYRISCL